MLTVITFTFASADIPHWARSGAVMRRRRRPACPFEAYTPSPVPAAPAPKPPRGLRAMPCAGGVRRHTHKARCAELRARDARVAPPAVYILVVRHRRASRDMRLEVPVREPDEHTQAGEVRCRLRVRQVGLACELLHARQHHASRMRRGGRRRRQLTLLPLQHLRLRRRGCVNALRRQAELLALLAHLVRRGRQLPPKEKRARCVRDGRQRRLRRRPRDGL
mmetsp:Transcript_13631/g.39461  ORF Transcript_13631/g.39461 Transcript_13631/m.39461 type:complete len:221 (-) Transcript_13631:613-1275(-)